jgi:hypothetical protein
MAALATSGSIVISTKVMPVLQSSHTQLSVFETDASMTYSLRETATVGSPRHSSIVPESSICGPKIGARRATLTLDDDPIPSPAHASYSSGDDIHSAAEVPKPHRRRYTSFSPSILRLSSVQQSNPAILLKLSDIRVY